MPNRTMRRVRYVVAALCLTSLGLATAACGGGSSAAAGGVKVAKLGHALTTSSLYQVGAERFAKLVKQKTNGKVEVKVFPNAQLGDEAALLSGLKAGSVDFSLTSTSVAATYDQDLSALVLPFLCSTADCEYKLLDGPVGKKIYASLEPHGIKELTTFEAGFRNLATNSTPPTSLKAIQGVPIRTPEGDLYVRTWKALGAVPNTLAWTETFTALQTGVVKATEAPLGPWADAKFYEVQKNYAKLHYLDDPIMMGVSVKFWNSLTADEQTAVQSAANEAAAYQRKLANDQLSELQKKLSAEQGVHFYSPDVAPFRQAVQPVIAYYKKQLGPVVDEVLQAVGQ